MARFFLFPLISFRGFGFWLLFNANKTHFIHKLIVVRDPNWCVLLRSSSAWKAAYPSGGFASAISGQVTMAAMDMVLFIHGLTHMEGMHWIWCLPQSSGFEGVLNQICHRQISLLALEFSAAAPHHRKVEPIRMACPRSLMGPMQSHIDR